MGLNDNLKSTYVVTHFDVLPPPQLSGLRTATINGKSEATHSDDEHMKLGCRRDSARLNSLRFSKSVNSLFSIPVENRRYMRFQISEYRKLLRIFIHDSKHMVWRQQTISNTNQIKSNNYSTDKKRSKLTSNL